MVLLASAGLSSWPRMQSGLRNPFQNAPGPFIYALPNLAGTCPFSFEDTILFCSFSGVGDSNKALDSNPNPDPDPHHHHHHHGCHNPAVSSPCCHHHDPPPPESAEPHTAPTEEGAPPDTESPLPLPPPPPSPPQTFASPSPDESHFDLPLGDYIISTLLAEDGSEPGQQLEPQANEPSSESSTPTPYTALPSPTVSNFEEASQEEAGEEVEKEKEKEKGPRHKRKRGGKRSRRRRQPEHGVSSVAPRFMGLSAVHYDVWTKYVCPQAPQFPLPAMSHHHPVGFVVPSNCPAPQFWMVPVVPAPGFVGLPVGC